MEDNALQKLYGRSGESVIYNKWWNSLSLAIWLHIKNARCKNGCFWNTTKSLGFSWWCLHTAALGEHKYKWMACSSSFIVLHFYSWYWQFQKEKDGLLKKYYSFKLIWPYWSIGQERSDDPKHQQLNSWSSDWFIIFFFYKIQEM